MVLIRVVNMKILINILEMKFTTKEKSVDLKTTMAMMMIMHMISNRIIFVKVKMTLTTLISTKSH